MTLVKAGEWTKKPDGSVLINVTGRDIDVPDEIPIYGQKEIGMKADVAALQGVQAMMSFFNAATGSEQEVLEAFIEAIGTEVDGWEDRLSEIKAENGES